MQVGCCLSYSLCLILQFLKQFQLIATEISHLDHIIKLGQSSSEVDLGREDSNQSDTKFDTRRAVGLDIRADQNVGGTGQTTGQFLTSPDDTSLLPEQDLLENDQHLQRRWLGFLKTRPKPQPPSPRQSSPAKRSPQRSPPHPSKPSPHAPRLPSPKNENNSQHPPQNTTAEVITPIGHKLTTLTDDGERDRDPKLDDYKPDPLTDHKQSHDRDRKRGDHEHTLDQGHKRGDQRRSRDHDRNQDGRKRDRCDDNKRNNHKSDQGHDDHSRDRHHFHPRYHDPEFGLPPQTKSPSRGRWVRKAMRKVVRVVVEPVARQAARKMGPPRKSELLWF